VRLGPLVDFEASVRSVLLDQGIEPVCESPGPSLGGVLVDQYRPHRRVPHAVHQLSRRCTRLGNEVVAGVAQIVEVESARKTCRGDDLSPAESHTDRGHVRKGRTEGRDQQEGPNLRSGDDPAELDGECLAVVPKGGGTAGRQ